MENNTTSEISLVPAEKDKVKVKLVGEPGNIFHLVAIASRAMKQAGQGKAAKEMAEKVYSSGSYEEALRTISLYCKIR